MLLSTELTPHLSGRKGEWACTSYANQVSSWRSWRGAAIAIGPVLEAYEGFGPVIENRLSFQLPTFLICGRIAMRRGFIPDANPRDGLLVTCPLLYDIERKEVTELINGEDEPVSYLWVDRCNAGALQAVRGQLTFLGQNGECSVVDAVDLSDCRRL